MLLSNFHPFQCIFFFVTRSHKKYQISNSTDAPTCAPQQPRVYGVAKHENAQIKCIVDANPPEVGKCSLQSENFFHAISIHFISGQFVSTSGCF